MHPGCSLLVKAAFLRVCLVSCKLLSCYCKRLRDMFSGEARSVSEVVSLRKREERQRVSGAREKPSARRDYQHGGPPVSPTVFFFLSPLLPTPGPFRDLC